MTDENRKDFDQALEILARVLRVTPLDSETKFFYFKALKSHSIEGFIEGVNRVTQTYKPKRANDFPVPAVISEAVTGAVNANTDPMESRSYEKIVESYRRRGILIGEEARARLEAEIDAKRQEADESWAAVEKESVLGREPF